MGSLYFFSQGHRRDSDLYIRANPDQEPTWNLNIIAVFYIFLFHLRLYESLVCQLLDGHAFKNGLLTNFQNFTVVFFLKTIKLMFTDINIYTVYNKTDHISGKYIFHREKKDIFPILGRIRYFTKRIRTHIKMKRIRNTEF